MNNNELSFIKDRGRLSFIKELSKNSTNTNLNSEEEYNNILKEWELHKVYSTEKYTAKCVCGQSLKNVCIIKNTVTYKTCTVGADCALKLMEQDYSYHFNKQSNLEERSFINKFTRELEKYTHEDIGDTFKTKFLSDIYIKINASLKKKYQKVYRLSEKQADLYYNIRQQMSSKIKDNPVKLPLLVRTFDLYADDALKTIKLLKDNDNLLFNTTFNPVLFSYLVYKGICTEEQYNKYYANSRYVFKKYVYTYKESNDKLQALLNKQIKTLQENIPEPDIF